MIMNFSSAGPTEDSQSSRSKLKPRFSEGRPFFSLLLIRLPCW